MPKQVRRAAALPMELDHCLCCFAVGLELNAQGYCEFCVADLRDEAELRRQLPDFDPETEFNLK